MTPPAKSPPPDEYDASSGLPGRASSEAERLAGLLQQCARGDQDAFSEFYDSTSSRVYGTILRVLRDPAQAEEVAQEVMVEAWRQSARYRPSLGTPLAWLLTIAHRRAVDRVRAHERAVTREHSYGHTMTEPAHDSTAEAALSAISARRVRSALAALTATQREALQLSYLSGYSHSEISLLLDIPLGTTKTRIRDALIRLRDTLGVSDA